MYLMLQKNSLLYHIHLSLQITKQTFWNVILTNAFKKILKYYLDKHYRKNLGQYNQRQIGYSCWNCEDRYNDASEKIKPQYLSNGCSGKLPINSLMKQITTNMTGSRTL